MQKLIKIPFADSGDKTTVPATDASGGVNMTQGYPIAYSKDPATDPSAKRIEREMFNGLMNLATSAINELQVNGVAPFITTADNGGTPFAYSTGATVLYQGRLWTSGMDNNTQTPGLTSSNWSLALTLADVITNVANTSGYFRISGKFMVSWGQTTPDNSPTGRGFFNVSYPVAFTQQPVIILGMRQSGESTYVQSNVIHDATRTGTGFQGRNLIVNPPIAQGGVGSGQLTNQVSGSNGGFWVAFGV